MTIFITNPDFFASVSDLLVHTKARLMKHTKLTPSCIDLHTNDTLSPLKKMLVKMKC